MRWALVGPLLYFQGTSDERVDLSVVLVASMGRPPPELKTQDEASVTASVIAEHDGRSVLRYAFSLPMTPAAWYEVDNVRYEVNTDYTGDLRIAFVSCNGQERGDRARVRGERNALWQRLVARHHEKPFQLILHGGDQIYADELVDVHPLARAWADDLAPAILDPKGVGEVSDALRQAFFRRYTEVLAESETSWMMARVPSLAMWDDHDICDGWGSLPASKLDSPIGQTLFEVARESFVRFQLGADPARLPGICVDAMGDSLTWHVRLPHLHLIAPDLRSERRPDRVMGEAGWRALDAALTSVEGGRVLLMSSVPALGPRLSWVERLLHLIPGMQKYEDDLRDQWQSRSHRAEWCHFLECLADIHVNADTRVTVLSGEIHVATRGTFDVPPEPMHQLVASGIVHPAAPRTYAWALGALARLGESPLPGHPIRLHPLPGKQSTYTPQRNFLVIERQDRAWRAWWELESDGPTPRLNI